MTMRGGIRASRMKGRSHALAMWGLQRFARQIALRTDGA
jgi:hypothetical protein